MRECASAISNRESGNMQALYWSATIAANAQRWSDRCEFTHSGSSYGEKCDLMPSPTLTICMKHLLCRRVRTCHLNRWLSYELRGCVGVRGPINARIRLLSCCRYRATSTRTRPARRLCACIIRKVYLASRCCIEYRAVVWADTQGLGCGMTSCAPLTDANGATITSYAILIVCDYRFVLYDVINKRVE